VRRSSFGALPAHCPGREQAAGAQPDPVCCNEHRMPCFEKLRHRSNDQSVILIAFDLLELDGNDLRREPFEVSQDDAGQPAARMFAGGAV
jgi:hypothetical protein